MNIKSIITVVLIAVIGLALYAATIRGIPGNPQGSAIKGKLDQATMPLELSPERGRYVLVMSLAEDRSFSLNPTLASAADPDIGYHDGRFYVYFGPGISLLALPLYFLGKTYGLAQVATFFTISIFATLNLILLFLLARQVFKLPYWAAILAALIFGFASSSWSYAITLYQHHVTTFIILSCFFAIFQYRKGGWTRFFWISYVWIAYAFSIFVDYPNGILIAPVMLYAFFSAVSFKTLEDKLKIRLDIIFVITAVFFIGINIVHGYYNYVNFGDWKRLSGGLVGIKEIRSKNLLKGNDQSAVQKEAADKNVVSFFQEVYQPGGSVILLVSRDRGIFLYAPIFVLGILGIFTRLKRSEMEGHMMVATIATHLFLYTSWGDPWGGWAFGPRYLIPMMSLLSLYAAYWLSLPSWGIVRRIFGFILIVYSSAIALLGALTTNAVPPKVEADYLHMKYNFLHNYDFFMSGRSSSYVFNTFVRGNYTLQEYFYLIWGTILAIAFILLFILPLFKRRYEHHA
ncbi:hypothetical protein KAZ66_02220 [Candidatus Woesebacteria bacterium]|nr:hypothetical protein [Candidatus Woesebacteria bacterium]